MNLIIKILAIIVFLGTGILTVWSFFKATKKYRNNETLKAIYYMLFSILFFLMNELG